MQVPSLGCCLEASSAFEGVEVPYVVKSEDYGKVAEKWKRYMHNAKAGCEPELVRSVRISHSQNFDSMNSKISLALWNIGGGLKSKHLGLQLLWCHPYFKEQEILFVKPKSQLWEIRTECTRKYGGRTSTGSSASPWFCQQLSWINKRSAIKYFTITVFS